MAGTINFMTFNVRHDHHDHSPTTIFAAPPSKENPLENEEFEGEQPWSIRKWKIVDTILLYSPDILALQEPVYHQLQDIEALLDDEYKWVGAGRLDGDKEGEFSAVFYKSEILKVDDWKTIWLSEQPDVAGSISWDARHPRTATQVTFRKNDAVFTVFNTHMDHVGIQSREEGSRLIIERAREASEKGAVILLGDLNSTEEDPAYLCLTNGKYKVSKGCNDTLANLQELNQVCASAYSEKSGEPVRVQENHITLPTHRVIRPDQILANLRKQEEQKELDQLNGKYFLDAHYELISRLQSKGRPGTLSGPYGYRNTLTSFGEGTQDFDRSPIRIDFIMPLESDTVNVRVLQSAILCNRFDDGLYISDHRPVFAKLSW
ncbi:Endonuclease/exonuclease/phosphatase [Parasitella parasitica]|nr:Endonuclease/exonuclease/phosphatase [Parasitella parasitica]